MSLNLLLHSDPNKKLRFYILSAGQMQDIKNTSGIMYNAGEILFTLFF